MKIRRPRRFRNEEKLKQFLLQKVVIGKTSVADVLNMLDELGWTDHGLNDKQALERRRASGEAIPPMDESIWCRIPAPKSHLPLWGLFALAQWIIVFTFTDDKLTDFGIQYSWTSI